MLAIVGGLLQLPAQADPADWFHRWDSDHNNCWSWPEFRDANMDWYNRHPQENRMEERELHRQYDEMARMHGGCVHPEDVRGYHAW
jgi:hypothetical protein